MLKGHTKIELTNVETGEVEVREEDNMFTNCLSEILNNVWIQFLAGGAKYNEYYLPLIEKKLSGVVLFADNIEEDVNQTSYPVGNSIVGYAGTIASDGTSKLWGSRNALESEAYDAETKSMKLVWDFNTSQANGTISCLGLTDGTDADYYGSAPWSKAYSGRYTDATAWFSGVSKDVIEFEGDDITYAINGTGTVTFVKERFNFSRVEMTNKLGARDLIWSHEVAMPGAAINYTMCKWKDGDDGYYYGFMVFSSSTFSTPSNTACNAYSASRYLQIIKVDKSTYEISYQNVTLPDGCYTYMPTCNPLITKEYIILPYSVSGGINLSDSSVKYVAKTSAIFINKQDWSVAKTNFVDESGTECSMITCGGSSGGNPCAHLYGGCFHNLKMQNGMYFMNGLILNDSGIVIEVVNAPVSAATGIPATETERNTYNADIRTSLNAYTSLGYQSSASGYSSSYYKYKTFSICLNKKRKIALTSFWNDGSLYFYIMPYDSQQLLTINNLAEPVTKTATQSMKITYTITEAQE